MMILMRKVLSKLASFNFRSLLKSELSFPISTDDAVALLNLLKLDETLNALKCTAAYIEFVNTMLSLLLIYYTVSR